MTAPAIVATAGPAAAPTAGLSGRSARLARRASEAASVRAWSTAPAFQALRVERVRAQVDALMWAGILGGLGFTAVNVQRFAADGAPAWSLPWLAAWLLDPMVSLVLIAVLRAEQVTARWQITTGPWVRRARWFCLGATYVMNTWTSWAALDPAGVVLHSVPPLVVFVAAEAVTDLRDKLTDAVRAAAAVPAVPDAGGLEQRGRVEPDTVPIPAATQHPEQRTDERTGESAGERGAPAARAARRRATRPRFGATGGADRAGAGGSSGRRVLAGEYLARARVARDAATAAGEAVEISAAWVRSVTGCSRGLSSQLARSLRAEHATNGDEAASEGAVNTVVPTSMNTPPPTPDVSGAGGSEPVRGAA